MNARELIKLMGSIIVCQLAGFIGSVFTVTSIKSWYSTLNQPWFNPPNWVFGPVWITLYTFMGIALYLVWSKRKSMKVENKAFIVFTAQLALNALWSIVYFGFQSISGAFMVIVILWLLIAWTIVLFKKYSRNAALLLVPYLLWVSFATILNFSYMLLN